MANPTEYSLADPGDHSAIAMNRADPVNVYLMCSKFKMAVGGLYPVLFVPSYLRGQISWSDFSNPCGKDFLMDVLKKLPEVTGEDFVLLDKEIHIKRPGLHTVPIGTECTRPGFYFITEDCQDDPSKYKVKLKYPNEVPEDAPQPLDNQDLKVYKRYTREKGYPHSPHRYGKRGKYNTFLFSPLGP